MLRTNVNNKSDAAKPVDMECSSEEDEDRPKSGRSTHGTPHYLRTALRLLVRSPPVPAVDVHRSLSQRFAVTCLLTLPSLSTRDRYGLPTLVTVALSPGAGPPKRAGAASAAGASPAPGGARRGATGCG